MGKWSTWLSLHLHIIIYYYLLLIIIIIIIIIIITIINSGWEVLLFQQTSKRLHTEVTDLKKGL